MFKIFIISNALGFQSLVFIRSTAHKSHYTETKEKFSGEQQTFCIETCEEGTIL